jgi:arsenite methyltransferase
MRELAAVRCAEQIVAGVIELREGTAEDTGCPDASVDAVLSVNNVMLWDRPAGFAELARVLRPDGRLVITVHRHVLDVPADRLVADATAAGFIDPQTSLRPRKRKQPCRRTARTPSSEPVADGLTRRNQVDVSLG